MPGLTDPQFAGVVMDAVTGDDYRRLAHWAIGFSIAESLDAPCTRVGWSSEGVIEFGVRYRERDLTVKFSNANGEEVLLEVSGALAINTDAELVDRAVSQSVARGQIFTAVAQMCEDLLAEEAVIA